MIAMDSRQHEKNIAYMKFVDGVHGTDAPHRALQKLSDGATAGTEGNAVRILDPTEFFLTDKGLDYIMRPDSTPLPLNEAVQVDLIEE